MFFKGGYFLWLTIFEDFEIILLQTTDWLCLIVGHNNIH